MEIALAVQEALANAVVHGCNNDASKEAPLAAGVSSGLAAEYPPRIGQENV